VELARVDPVVVLALGDPCHGMKYAHQFVSTRRANQILIAWANRHPWLSLPNVGAVRQVDNRLAALEA